MLFLWCFLLVGLFWIRHRQVFRSVVRLTAPVVALDVAFLACIAYLPFSGSLLFDADLTTVTVGLCAGNVTAAGLVLILTRWLTARHRDLIDSAMSDADRARQGIELASIPVAFGIGCTLAFVNPGLASWA